MNHSFLINPAIDSVASEVVESAKIFSVHAEQRTERRVQKLG